MILIVALYMFKTTPDVVELERRESIEGLDSSIIEELEKTEEEFNFGDNFTQDGYISSNPVDTDNH